MNLDDGVDVDVDMTGHGLNGTASALRRDLPQMLPDSATAGSMSNAAGEPQLSGHGSKAVTWERDVARAVIRFLTMGLSGALFGAPMTNLEMTRRARFAHGTLPRWRRVIGWWPALLALWTFYFTRLVLSERGLALSSLGRGLVITAAVIAAIVIRSRPIVTWRILVIVALVYPFIARQPDWAPAFPITIMIVWVLAVLVIAIGHRVEVLTFVVALSMVPLIVVVSPAIDARFGWHNEQTASLLAAALALAALIGVGIKKGISVRERLVAHHEEIDTELAKRTVLEERARIARDLHDVVAHHMSMMAIQAESAPFRLDNLSDDALNEFEKIAVSARRALNETRALVGVLRSDNENLQTAPQPGLENLDRLIAGVQSSGLTVSLAVTGDISDLPLPVSQGAYRIVQEAITNASRHAPGSAVAVTIDHTDAGVGLRISNEGGTQRAGDYQSPIRAGHGIVGMRERAASVGGHLGVARVDGGFVVVASLPVHHEVAGV